MGSTVENPLQKLRENQYYGMYLGKVEEVETGTDLKKRTGRVKVRVMPMYAEVKVEFIQWAVPAYPMGADRHDTPEVNDLVFCFFQAGDIFQPVYAFKTTHLVSNTNPSTPEAAYQEPSYYAEINAAKETSIGNSGVDEPTLTYTDDYPDRKVTKQGNLVTERNVKSGSEEELEVLTRQISSKTMYERTDANGDKVIKKRNIFLLAVQKLILKAASLFFDGELVIKDGSQELVRKDKLDELADLLSSHIHTAQGATSPAQSSPGVPLSIEVDNIKSSWTADNIKTGV